MKVLICTTALDTAVTGAGRVAKMLSQWHVYDPAMEVHVLSEGIRDNQPGHHHVLLNSMSAIPVITYLTKARQYRKSLMRLLETQVFDVILFFDAWLAYGTPRLLRSHDLSMPVVAFLHDANTLDLSKNFQLNGRNMAFLFRRWLEKATIPQLDALITNSDYMRERITRVFPDTPVFRLYYTAYDYSAEDLLHQAGSPASPYRILFIKNDFLRGGLADLLAALKMLPEMRFELTIAGPRKSLVLRKLNKAIQDAGNVSVQFAGRVTVSAEMIRLYHAHDMVCVPSHSEAFGLANAEALACGTPVVSSCAGGIPEVLGDGAYGLMCPPGRPEKLAEAIRTCLSDTEGTMARTMAGREYVMKKFSAKTMFADLKAILTQAGVGSK